MAHVHADGVVDTSTTTGTGALTLDASPPTGFQTFSAVMTSPSDTCFYFIRHQTENEWEQGLGTYSAANTLTRTTVIKSSNSDAAVNFSAGTKNVFITDPAERDIPRLFGANTDNALLRADSTDGNVQDSGILVDDSDNLTMPASSLLLTAATATGGAGLRIPHGTAPSPPTDGDLWSTTTGVYARVNGATVGPFAQAGALIWNYLGTLTASASATLEDATNITSTYDHYAFILEDLIPATDSQNLRIRLSTDGGSTYASTGYDSTHMRVSTAVADGQETTYFNPCIVVGNDANYGISGTLFLSNVNSSNYKRMYGEGIFPSATAAATGFMLAGFYEGSTSAVDGIQFSMDSGNLTSGDIHIYGLSTS